MKNFMCYNANCLIRLFQIQKVNVQYTKTVPNVKQSGGNSLLKACLAVSEPAVLYNVDEELFLNFTSNHKLDN